MKHLFSTLGLFLICALMATDLTAQSAKKSVKMTITRDIDGVTTTIDTSFTVNDPSEVEDVLRKMGIDEPKENQTLEKRIVIRDIEEEGPEREVTWVTSAKPMIGVYLSESSSSSSIGNNITNWLNFNRDDEDNDQERGVYVSGLTKNGGAQDVGIQKGDVILNVDGMQVNSIQDVSDAKAGHSPGDKVNIIYEREGRTNSVVVTLKAPQSHQQHKPTRQVKVTEQKTFLGVVPTTVCESTAENMGLPTEGGVLLSSIVSGHSAEAAGLQAKDVIIMMDGKTVEGNGDLREVLQSHEPGDRINIVYYRDGKRQSTPVTLGSKTYTNYKRVNIDNAQKIEEKRAFLGVYLETAGDDEGVRITRVSRNTAAEHAGLEDDDIITRIGSHDTPNYSALTKALRTYKPEDRVVIRYTRDGMRGSTNVTLGSKSVTKWVAKEKSTVKSQEIDVEVIFREWSNQEEAEELVDNMRNPKLSIPDFTVYPNPSQGRFSLSFTPNGVGPIRIKVYNFNGQVVYQEQLTDFEGSYDKEIDISDNAKGTYYLQVTQNGDGMAKKLVVR